MRGSMRTTFGVAAGATALAAVSLVGLGGFASAATGDGGDGGHPGRPALTDEQKTCLSDNGVTLPERPSDGSRPTPPTEEQRAAMKAAAETCGLPAPRARSARPALTDEQKTCLSDNGVTLPERPSDGSRPTPPTEEQRAAMKAAAETCGLPTPAGPGHGPGRGDGATAQATSVRVSV